MPRGKLSVRYWGWDLQRRPCLSPQKLFDIFYILVLKSSVLVHFEGLNRSQKIQEQGGGRQSSRNVLYRGPIFKKNLRKNLGKTYDKV